jgi:hypothetical protein
MPFDDLDEEVTEEGPAMRKLTLKQKKFVEYILNNPTCDWRAAAVYAGYAPSNQNALGAAAYNLRHNHRVIAALAEAGTARLQSGSIVFISGLLSVAEDKTHKDNFQAIRLGLALTGHQETTKHELSVEHRVEDPLVAIEKLKLLAERRGIPAQNLLEHVIDADFAVVKPVDDDLSDVL